MTRKYLICSACGFRTRLLWKFNSHRATACPVKWPRERARATEQKRRDPLHTHRLRRAGA